MSSRILSGAAALTLLLLAAPASAAGSAHRSGRAHASRGAVFGGAGCYPYRAPNADGSDVPVAPPGAVPDERLLLWLASGNPCYGCHWGTPGASLIAPPSDAGNVVMRTPQSGHAEHTPHMKIIDVAPDPAKEPSARPVRGAPKTATGPVMYI